MIWGTSKRRIRAGNATEGASATSVQTTQRTLKTVFCTLIKLFQDFALLEPFAMCYPFREDIEVDSLSVAVFDVFHLNSSAVEDEILTLQADIHLKYSAHGQFWNSHRKRTQM